MSEGLFINCGKLSRRNEQGEKIWEVDMDEPEWYFKVADYERKYHLARTLEIASENEGLAAGWIQYKCRGCGGVSSALKDSLCGHYQVCETCARKKSLGDSNMLPPGQVWLKEGSPGSGRYA